MEVAPAPKVIENLLDEWKRSMLTFWTLSLVLIQPSYGLQIKKEIETSTQGKMKLGVSTIYQLLRRLENRGMVESYWEHTTQGPPRAYYRITSSGREVVRRYVMDVLSPDSPIASALNQLMPLVFQHLAEQ